MYRREPAGMRGYEAREANLERRLVASFSRCRGTRPTPTIFLTIVGLNVPGLPQVLEDAIAVIFRTGSGDRLTSRCCREITLAVLLFIAVGNRSITVAGTSFPSDRSAGQAAFSGPNDTFGVRELTTAMLMDLLDRKSV